MGRNSRFALIVVAALVVAGAVWALVIAPARTTGAGADGPAAAAPVVSEVAGQADADPPPAATSDAWIDRTEFIGRRLWVVPFGSSTVGPDDEAVSALIPDHVDGLSVQTRSVDCDTGSRAGLRLPAAGPAWYSSLYYRTRDDAAAARKAMGFGGDPIPVTPVEGPGC
jgi:hypothetical protein